MKVGNVLVKNVKGEETQETCVVISKKTETLDQGIIAILQNIKTKKIYPYDPSEDWLHIGEWDYFHKQVILSEK